MPRKMMTYSVLRKISLNLARLKARIQNAKIEEQKLIIQINNHHLWSDNLHAIILNSWCQRDGRRLRVQQAFKEGKCLEEVVSLHPINGHVHFHIQDSLMNKYGTTLRRKFNMKPTKVGEAITTMMLVSNWLKIKTDKMEIKLKKLLQNETKAIRKKQNLSKNTNEYCWGDGYLLRFKEEHFIGFTGIRYQSKRMDQIEKLKRKIRERLQKREYQLMLNRSYEAQIGTSFVFTIN